MIMNQINQFIQVLVHRQTSNLLMCSRLKKLLLNTIDHTQLIHETSIITLNKKNYNL